MKNTRYALSVLAIALSFSQAPPVSICAEEITAGNAGRDTAAVKQNTEPSGEQMEYRKAVIRSIFLESENGFDPSHPDEHAVLVSEKETELPGEEIDPDYNFRASENDEFALYSDGAVLNEDHYLLSRIIVSGSRKKDVIRTGLPVEYIEDEKDVIQITLVYIFVQPWHLVTIHYEDIDSGEELFEPEIQKYAGSSNLNGPVSYDLKEFIKIRFEGYRFRGVSGDTLIGDVNSDKEIHILYEKQS